MRPRAQAETAAFHAARARTAATLAFNKLPYQTRQQLGAAPPTTEALEEAILQRTRLAAIPLPAAPATAPPLAPAMPQQHGQQQQQQQRRPEQAQAERHGAAFESEGAPAATSCDGRPIPSGADSPGAAVKAAPASARHRDGGAAAARQAAQAANHPPETALLPASAVQSGQRHTVRLVPCDAAAQATAAASGASPYIELVKLK